MTMNATDDTPWTFKYVEESLNGRLLKYFRGERSGFVQVGPKRYFLPERFAREGNQYYKFKPRPSDIWVVSFPRSGTTWTQEMVWLLANELNFSKSAEIPLVERFPFLEFSSCVHEEVLQEFLDEAENEAVKMKLRKACGSIIEDLENSNEPRFIKTHLPFSLLNPELLTCGAKVLYVARNPKDVSVSYYHFHQFIKTLDYVGDFENFWSFFQNNLQLWTPYWEHVNEAWQLRNNPNMLFLFYEDLKKDLIGNVKSVADFFGKKYSEESLKTLVSHLEFNNFQKNQSVNMEVLRELGMLSNYSHKCIRNGKAGGWKELFTSALNERADAWIKQNMESRSIVFPEAFKVSADL